MRSKSYRPQVTLIVLTASLLIVAGGAQRFAMSQGRAPQLNISAEEQKLAKTIQDAPDAEAKLLAAETLIHKYPKTLIRPRIAQGVADKIADVKDASQKIKLAQEYQKTFQEESERSLIIPVLVDGYVAAGRADEAFSTGAEVLAHQPDSLPILVRLTLAGTEEAKKQNSKFIVASLQYGAKAIEIIEADKKTADLNDAGWTYYKSLRPNLYQSLGLLNVIKGDSTEAKAKFLKAEEIAPADPFNYLMVGSLLNEDYKSEAKRVLQMPEGQARQDALQKVLAMLDNVIDAYAHMIAMSEGSAQFQQMRQQYLEDLQSYYKFRHHSTEGMQQLIDKYKVASKPQ